MTKEIRVLSFGGGVQSSTLLLMAIHGELKKPIDHVIFADTGYEPKGVYEWIETLKPLAEKAGIPFHIVSAGNIKEDTFSPGRFASIPFHVLNDDGTRGIARRQCTQDYKIIPVQKKERELVGLKPRQRWNQEKHGVVINLMGISTDEIQRMKDNRLAPNIINEYPLIDMWMSRYDCIRWCQEKGYGRPPRSACIACPYHSDKEWRKMKMEDPESFEEAVRFEKALQTPLPMEGDVPHQKDRFKGTLFLHNSCKPLDEIDFRNEEDRGQTSLFDQECEGMCGI
jgi:hypothetical protein|tara:strand:+ start:654 stop:1502 length:849 start_codon:yes stop_codon:yes gene_type:complete